ncbi:hypothetical protein F5148DRAFT_1326745 [Russula earlei]|uniref:Uncharacterized protein n=1 Tax=Russula earlei TaxID=71964 RepID=A0ACC0TZ61_9AGAM|nr:hypothetical protein F5148DRAFT_1326745 [Russula earlei]
MGGFLGCIVNLVLCLLGYILFGVLHMLSTIMDTIGQALGGALTALFNKPAHWIAQSNHAFLLKWLIIRVVLYARLLGLKRTSLVSYIPSLPAQTTTRYQAPKTPATNIAELSAHLQALENALTGLSLDFDSQSWSNTNVFCQLGALESHIQKEGVCAAEDQNVNCITVTQGLQVMHHEIDALQRAVAAVQQSENAAEAAPTNDELACAKLSILEECVGNFEGSLQEALKLGKNSAKMAGSSTAATAVWWSKIMFLGKNVLSIKALDGQDVTELVGYLVDTAMMSYYKDLITKADFVLHLGCTMVIPSLTLDMHEIKPEGMWQQVIEYLTGHGYALGWPPITALHHETHVNHCWPFKGDQGQLSIMLSHIVQIEEILIDHAKVAALDEALTKAGKEIQTQPRSLLSSARYMCIMQFKYNANVLSQAVQMFPVEEGVLSNWGQQFTCLFRFHMHRRMILNDKLLVAGAEAHGAENVA